MTELLFDAPPITPTALDGEVLPPAKSEEFCPSDAELADLGYRIRLEQKAGERSLKDAVEHFRQCGEMLLEAKARLPHGNFLHFLQHEAKLHPRMAQRYMLLAKSLAAMPKADATRVSQLSLRDAIAELSRTSNRAAKLTPPSRSRALDESRREPLKSALCKAVNTKRYGDVSISTAPTGPFDPPPPPPVPPHVEGLIRTIESAIRACVETCDDIGTQEVLDALNQVYCDIQDQGLAAIEPVEQP